MELITLYEKGVYLEVTSWENDGDNYKTISTKCRNLEHTKALLHLVKTLGASNYGNSLSIGNFSEDDILKAASRIIEYFKENLWVLKELEEDKEYYEMLFDNEGNLLEDEETTNKLYHIAMSNLNELMSYSDWYLCRVFESARAFEVSEDVVANEIQL